MGIRKKLTTTRHLFRTMKWVCYHAHPVNIVGHPFKGSYVMSTGYLAHPDMKRFALDDATLYVPPRPDAWVISVASRHHHHHRHPQRTCHRAYHRVQLVPGNSNLN